MGLKEAFINVSNIRDTSRYLMVLGHCKLVLVGTGWYLVIQVQYRAFMPAYIEKVEIWSSVTNVYRLKDRQQNIGLLKKT